MDLRTNRLPAFRLPRPCRVFAAVCAALFVLASPALPVRAAGWTLAWTPGPSMPLASHWAGTGVVNGQIYYFGGGFPASNEAKTMRFDPATNQWQRLADMIYPRVLMAGAAGPDGRLYAIGGYRDNIGVTAIVEVFTPASGAWTSGPSLTVARHNLAAASTGDGTVYAIGGSLTGAYTPLPVVEALHQGSGTWVRIPDMPGGRTYPAAVGAPDGKLYVLGGYAGVHTGGTAYYNASQILASMVVFNPDTEVWTELTPMPSPRSGLTAVMSADGRRIYAIGGFYGSFAGDPASMLDRVDVYDVATDTWTSDAPTGSPRYGHGSALVDNTIYVFGGYDARASLTSMLVSGAPAPADTTAPTTSASLAGLPGNNTWYRSAVTVTLTAADDDSGVAVTHYRVGSAGWLVYEEPFEVSAEGTTTVLFSSTDQEGNVEPERSLEVRIDTVAPTVTFRGNAGTYSTTQQVAITCAASDAGSGIEWTDCRDIVGPASSFPLGVNTFTATASDAAGNVSTTFLSFTVQDTANPFDLLRQAVLAGVTKAGIAQALLAKIDAAEAAARRGDAPAMAGILKAFVNQVEAQTGKAIPPEVAALLIRLARSV